MRPWAALAPQDLTKTLLSHSMLALCCGCLLDFSQPHAAVSIIASMWTAAATALLPMQIPKEAAVMDLVFSDSGEAGGGFFDNNNGLEYHFPITGSSSPQPSLFIVHVSVEMAPIAKVSVSAFGTSAAPVAKAHASAAPLLSCPCGDSSTTKVRQTTMWSPNKFSGGRGRPVWCPEQRRRSLSQ